MAVIKSILLVSSAFYPEISPRSFRATELAKEFCRQGHDVVVISKFRNHDYTDFLKKYPIKFKMWGRSRFPQVPVFNRWPFSTLGRWMSRMLLQLLEYPGIEEMFKVHKMLKGEGGYELMVSFAYPYPVHWGTAWTRTKKNRIADTWVADCGDPYMGAVLDSFRKMFYFSCFEKWFCRRSDYISIPVESAREAYYSEFHRKIKVIPQGFSFELNKRNEFRKTNPVPIFAYAGGFLRGIRDPELLLSFLTEIEQPFKFLVFTDKPDLLGRYKLLLNEKLVVSNYIERDKLMDILFHADFLINFDNNTTVHVPSKLIDYAITGRPVLNVDKSFNIEVLRAFINGDYSKRMQLPDPEHFHITGIASAFLGLTNHANHVR